MSNVQDPEKVKKNKREYIITMLMLLLISGASAAYVIRFRIKMKPYQVPAEQLEKEEAEKAAQNPEGVPQGIGR